eukprot:PhF_6_TR43368/c0_g1_i1/m.66477
MKPHVLLEITLFFGDQSLIAFNTTCALELSHARPNVSISCPQGELVRVVCPPTGCLSVSSGGGIPVGVTLIGCQWFGQVLDMNAVFGTLIVRDSVLDGLWTYTLLSISEASAVILKNTVIRNGYNIRSGGCVGIDAISETLVIWNVSISGCVSLGKGGCLSAMQREDANANASLTSSYFYNCTSMNDGGLLSFRQMTTVNISNSNLQAGTTSQDGGAISLYQILLVYMYKTTFSDCRSEGVGGCLRFSTSSTRLSTYIVDECVIASCSAKTSSGSVVFTDAEMLFTNSIVRNASTNKGSGGCIGLNSVE